ncbi:pyridoxal phosphate-dependent decarboxylase family protein [Marinirhabdus gelatinilytica]|uniref:Sulfinoalanine decarboxylase/sulfinoalanine decarboxylase/aspartate 1-decarboxylase n=1 Tax=Marinirhabdus gelatinilytica TaxID=1703343 RepID=A0A370Q712_9FLAO|nr:aminotransferase class V-fold PLP-dependent enzyme [Marinirhabdus gelatinilytica]RDK84165.1 sulfinoalanine decarboxylase/sulfinoalanine decarboxylase/aspartate 1-decarboxylase [Marinirhabdus gelatinilytica]
MNYELDLFNKLAHKLFEAEGEHPVTKPIPAGELFRQLDLTLKENPDPNFESTIENLILSTPRTATKLFFNQLFGGRNPKATLGDLLAVLLNNSMYTYKVAGPQVGVEKEILHNICNLIGYPNTSDGTFAPGGSMSNFMAMVMARDNFNETIRLKGAQGKMIVYTSAESHYSIPKNASLMGVGRDQVRFVATDAYGKMLPEALQKLIEKDIEDGNHPFFVNATAGTTVLGAFDSIEPLSEICKKHNLWLHVDGAYCGSIIFSNKYKHLVHGLELSNSFSVNAHKMMGTPLTCSIIVTRDKKHLNNSFSNDAAYLYQTDGDDYNLGKTSIQCGRRNDALKFWTLWKSVGTSGLEKIVDQQFQLAEVARNYIKDNSDYTLYSFDDSISVCFNYKNIPAQQLCTALYEHAELMVGYGTFQENEFVRLVTINSGNKDEDILNFFKILENFVEENEALFSEAIAEEKV